MNLLPHMAARLFGAPLMIHRPKLEVILAVLGSRIGLPQATAPRDAISDRSIPRGTTGIVVLPVYGTLVRRNDQLAAEVKDLKEGLAALEERARNDLGMIGANETFFQVVDADAHAGVPAPPAAARPERLPVQRTSH